MADHDLKRVLQASRRKTVRDRKPDTKPSGSLTLTSIEWLRLRTMARRIRPALLQSYRALSPRARIEIKNLARVEFDVSATCRIHRTLSLLKAAAALRSAGSKRREVDHFVSWSARSASIAMYVKHTAEFGFSREQGDRAGRPRAVFWTENRIGEVLAIASKYPHLSAKKVFQAWRKFDDSKKEDERLAKEADPLFEPQREPGQPPKYQSSEAQRKLLERWQKEEFRIMGGFEDQDPCVPTARTKPA
ncbi:MAG: hypothetical protein ACOH2T_27960 [Pseudomonas sp.]